MYKQKLIKNLFLLLLLLLVTIACKPDTFTTKITKKLQTETDISSKKERALVKVVDSFPENENQLKIAKVRAQKDDAYIFENTIESRRFKRETATYTIDFCYPYLNEGYNPKFEIFNNYVKEKLLKLSEIENNVREAQELLCDTIVKNKINRECRIADYKIYTQNDEHLSVLFYLENHYTGTKATYYTFETINFDMIKGKLLGFEDYFPKDKIAEVHTIVNNEITTAITNGTMFYECFPVSLEDFKLAKNNFVLNDDTIVFYFNDCVMCSSFVGTYEIEIPLEKFKLVFKKYWIEAL
ncbi:DUF3298 domain-containing protein [Tenacibaculum sp. 190524A02b]|uniref:RsiV family protein n=1 Tax=Tenacibaculum vairaonense TaxID=3137860 RepID=UPI0031FB195D